MKTNSSKFPWAQGKRMPAGFWRNVENRKQFIRWLRKEVGVKRLDDWYRPAESTMDQISTTGILGYYDRSYMRMVMDLVPGNRWQPWKFRFTDSGFWRVRQNRIAYLKWLGKELGYKRPEDWYQVFFRDFIDNNGIGITRSITEELSRSRTLVEIVSELYPRYDWLPWKFQKVPRHYWQEISHRRKFMKWLGRQLGYRKMTDWYDLTKYAFIENKAKPLLQHVYGGVPYRAVKETFPAYDWKAWLFYSIPNGFWEEKKNRVDYLRWLGQKIEVREPDDWYRIDTTAFACNFGGHLLHEYYGGSPRRALEELYPNRTWHQWLFQNVNGEFWDKKSNRLAYYRWLSRHSGLTTRADWQGLTRADLAGNHGSGLIRKFPIAQICREGVSTLSQNANQRSGQRPRRKNGKTSG